MINRFKVLMVLKIESGTFKFELIVLLILGKASTDVTQEASTAEFRVFFKRDRQEAYSLLM